MSGLTRDDLHVVIRFPRTCDCETTRDGISVPCDKPAVAIAAADRLDVHPYTVCKHHARGREMVTIAELFDALEVRE